MGPAAVAERAKVPEKEMLFPTGLQVSDVRRY
jgi:hypothetical protein